MVEMIVVDGGTTEVLWFPQPAEGRIQYIREKDDGIYDGMNKGVAASSGKYIWFLNGGDLSVVSGLARVGLII